MCVGGCFSIVLLIYWETFKNDVLQESVEVRKLYFLGWQIFSAFFLWVIFRHFWSVIFTFFWAQFYLFLATKLRLTEKVDIFGVHQSYHQKIAIISNIYMRPHSGWGTTVEPPRINDGAPYSQNRHWMSDWKKKKKSNPKN